MRLHMCEPALGEGQVTALSSLMDGLFAKVRSPAVGPFLRAIDGRSSNGKSTLASRIAAVTSGAEVVHTDDVAWWGAG